MCTPWKEQFAVILTVILLAMINAAYARPRRRFCEIYPFAPRCLGVAAKRSVQLQNDQTPLDIYSKVIKSVLEEAHRAPATFTETSPLGEKPATFRDSTTLWDKLVALVQETQPGSQRQTKYRPTDFMDVEDSWDDAFADGEDRI